jgi:uncharacterized protein (DUF2225 family)
MNKSSKKNMLSFFGLFVCLFAILHISVFADEKDKEKKKKKDDGLVGESKLIFDSGIGKFDWTGKKNNYTKSTETARQPTSKESDGKANCPVCSKTIEVTNITSTRYSLDYDFCEHFIGSSPYVFDIWCCSVCGFTANNKSFEQPVADEDKAFVKKYMTAPLHKEIKAEFGDLLKDLNTKPLSQKIIPAKAKIKNFVAFIDHRNDLDDKWKAFYYVRAVYALRNLISVAPSCTSLNKAFIDISKKVDQQVKIPEEDKQMPHVSAFYLNFYLYILPDYAENSKERLALHILNSQCFNRLGYYTESKNHLNKANEIFLKLKDAQDVEKILKTQGELIDLEKSYSLKAVSYMKDALEDKLDYGKNQSAIVYLIGELSRRSEVYADAYLFLSASKMLFPKETPVFTWVEDHLKRKELKNDEFLLLTPPAYLKQIVLDNNKK